MRTQDRLIDTVDVLRRKKKLPTGLCAF